MELTPEQETKLLELIRANINTNTKLKEIICAVLDSKQKLIFESYNKLLDENEVSEKLNISIKEVQDTIDFCLSVYDKINKVSKQVKTAQKQVKNDNKDKIRKELNEYKKEMPNLDKEKLKKDLLPKIIKCIKYLGNDFYDVMFLVDVYIKIEEYNMAEEIVNYVETDELNYQVGNAKGKKILLDDKKRIVLLNKNKSYVQKLYYKYGDDIEKIMKEAEKQNSTNRKYLSMKFIRQIINECKQQDEQFER